jgi:hypothetical protein
MKLSYDLNLLISSKCQFSKRVIVIHIYIDFCRFFGSDFPVEFLGNCVRLSYVTDAIREDRSCYVKIRLLPCI